MRHTYEWVSLRWLISIVRSFNPDVHGYLKPRTYIEKYSGDWRSLKPLLFRIQHQFSSVAFGRRTRQIFPRFLLVLFYPVQHAKLVMRANWRTEACGSISFGFLVPSNRTAERTVVCFTCVPMQFWYVAINDGVSTALFKARLASGSEGYLFTGLYDIVLVEGSLLPLLWR